MVEPLLEIRDLRTHFESARGTVRAVDGVWLSVGPARTTALVGESGCGKTVTALSILRLLPAGGRISGGEIRFDGRDLLTLGEAELRRVRGGQIGMVFQEPAAALNPVLTIGRQVAEVLELHRGLRGGAARARAVECLAQAALTDPARVAESFSHQLSGGMRQRAMIAMALAGEPELLIADEPTTALDVTVQAQILTLLKSLARERGLAMLLVTHDLGVVSAVADDVAVMYAGRVVETGSAAAVLGRPRHPYTQGLLRCVPRIRGPRAALHVVPGAVPDPAELPSGCRFHPRCELGAGEARCREEEQAPRPVASGGGVACWKAGVA